MTKPNRNWMDDEPQKVDWAIDEEPDCKDCLHLRESNSSWSLCTKAQEIVSLKMMRNWADDQLGWAGCKGGKFFERKDREPGNYGFERDPLVPMSRAKDN